MADAPSTSGSLQEQVPSAERLVAALRATGELEKLRTLALEKLEKDVSCKGPSLLAVASCTPPPPPPPPLCAHHSHAPPCHLPQQDDLLKQIEDEVRRSKAFKEFSGPRQRDLMAQLQHELA